MDDDYVSLNQAIEYVAFRDFEYHGAEENFGKEDKLKQASTNLWRAVEKNYVSLYKEIRDNYVKVEIRDFATGEQYLVVADGFEQSDFNCSDVLFRKTELINNFPPANQARTCNNKQNTDEYTTQYIDIMRQVIDEEHISDESQGKKDALVAAFITKMECYGLPNSKNLAEAMATLIRHPDSQKGKRKKL